jgi:hypothetical protein
MSCRTTTSTASSGNCANQQALDESTTVQSGLDDLVTGPSSIWNSVSGPHHWGSTFGSAASLGLPVGDYPRSRPQPALPEAMVASRGLREHGILAGVEGLMTIAQTRPPNRIKTP